MNVSQPNRLHKGMKISILELGLLQLQRNWQNKIWKLAAEIHPTLSLSKLVSQFVRITRVLQRRTTLIISNSPIMSPFA